MDTVASEIGRDAAGRFVAGQSGNPAGKLPGTRNRKTVLMAALRDGEGEAAARVVIERALSGDPVAARFVVALISPRPRGRTIHIEMPEDDDCNVVAAFNATLRALANSEITPDEAVTVSRFLDGRRGALRAWQLEMQLRSHGRTIPGDPDWTEDAEDSDDDENADDAEPDKDAAPAMRAEPSVPVAGPAAAPRPAAPAAPPAAPVAADEAAAPPPPADAAAATLPAAAPLQSACISPSPRTLRGFLSIPAGGLGATPAAGVAQRLRPVRPER
jgi:hypothetical protein